MCEGVGGRGEGGEEGEKRTRKRSREDLDTQSVDLHFAVRPHIICFDLKYVTLGTTPLINNSCVITLYHPSRESLLKAIN